MTHSHTAYTPLWYKPENIGKYNSDVSRQINFDKINPLPRLSLQASSLNEYGEFELELLSKAENYGLSVPHDTFNAVDFAELEYLVDQYEALDEEGKFFAEQARNYHIPIKNFHLEDIIKLHFEIEDYENLLDEAITLRLNWDTSTYDIDGLIEAITGCREAQADDYRCYVYTVNSVYKAAKKCK